MDVIRFHERYEMSVAFVLGFLGVKGVEFISSYLTEKIQKDGANQDNK